MFSFNQDAREAGDAVRQAVGVQFEPHKSAAAQRRQSVNHSSITIAAITVMLFPTTVLLTLLVVLMFEVFYSLRRANVAA